MSTQPESDDFEIYPYLEVFYIVSLLFCTESALASAKWVADLLKSYRGKEYDFPPQPALDRMQNIALQGAAISRFFWPSGKKYQRRGEILRAKLSITENSPLYSRDLRNRMEHFDEYLDDYLRDCNSGHFIPDYFGPKPSGDRGPVRLFRAYFTNTGEFEILGSTFHVQPVVDEIARLHKVLQRSESAGSRLPRQASDSVA